MRRRTASKALCAALLPGAGLVPGAVRAAVETTPRRPITFVVPFTAGAAPDGLVRALAHEVGQQAGVPVVVDNRPGAGSALAATAVSRATPDGHTVLVTGNVTMTGNPHVMRRLPYDPARDFTPVTPLSRGPMVLYVNPATVVSASVQDLVLRLRRQPLRYSFAYTSITSRLPAEVLQRGACNRLTGIPYLSGAAALSDLLSGRVDLLFTDFSPWPHVASGRLRALAVTGALRSPSAPELPTFAETGIKDMDIGFWIGAYLPAQVDEALVMRLQGWLRRAGASAAVQEAHKRLGTVEFTLAPAQFARFQAWEMQTWGHLIRQVGIEAQ
ncbi:Bug family tripartite tricarboxylate transporter substrate binding protein [Azohydromonas lata]|uniref:Bug family tripartite tricarboxylate transporter substrate binding protein n=1 Tax=Azohydromonas lata TaxID=45677 RepID=UPI000A527E85|nr:tripartite tricarboxylate transporter substrate binding protein [Azohydromonas lata]